MGQPFLWLIEGVRKVLLPELLQNVPVGRAGSLIKTALGLEPAAAVGSTAIAV